jgi:hypothetical protein
VDEPFEFEKSPIEAHRQEKIWIVLEEFRKI